MIQYQQTLLHLILKFADCVKYVNLRRKTARLVNTRILKKEGQTIDNVSDASLIKTIFTSANLNVSKVLNTESKEMALWKVHYEPIVAVNASWEGNTQTIFDSLLLNGQLPYLQNITFCLQKNCTSNSCD